MPNQNWASSLPAPFEAGEVDSFCTDEAVCGTTNSSPFHSMICLCLVNRQPFVGLPLQVGNAQQPAYPTRSVSTEL
jgi:hypothetical protein